MNPMVRPSPQARVFSEIREHFHGEFSLLLSETGILHGRDHGIDSSFAVVLVYGFYWLLSWLRFIITREIGGFGIWESTRVSVAI